MSQPPLPPQHPPVPAGILECPVASVSRDPAHAAAYASDEARLRAVQSIPLQEGKTSSFVLGTRMSKLAMKQTNLVKSELEKLWPEVEVRIYGMVSGVRAAEIVGSWGGWEEGSAS